MHESTRVYSDLIVYRGDNRESSGFTNSPILKIRGDIGNNEQIGIRSTILQL